MARSRPIHVWTSPDGQASPPPVVLLHGVVSSRYLLPTASWLARRHPVLAIDMPGFGRSPRPPRPLELGELADTAAEVVASAGIDAAVVVGHSIGAQIAVDLALRRPELVMGLVLVGPTGDPRMASVGRLWGRWIATAPSEPLAFNGLTLHELAAIGPRRMLATARSAVVDPFVAKLRLVRVPSLVVRGERDRVAPADWANDVCVHLGGAPLRVIPGAAHTVVFSAPRQLACLISGFAEGR